MNKMKTGFQFVLSLLVLFFVFSFGLPVWADGEETEAPPVVEEVVPVVVVPVVDNSPVIEDAPVVIVDNDTAWIDGRLVTWGGWVGTIIFASLFLLAIKELVKQGNEKAVWALRFFEASKEMLPVDKWQQAFEQRAKTTPNPFDDMAAAGTRALGEQTGLLDKVPPEAARG